MTEENSPRSVPETESRSTVNTPSSGSSKSTSRPYTAPKKRNKTVILVVVILVVLVGGFFLWRYLRTYESTDDAQVDVHLYPVSARISGYVVKVNVDDNQWVQQGTVLVEIDPKDYEVAVAQAQANLANAEATAQSLNITVPITSTNTSSQLRSTASGIENSQAGILAAEQQLTAARAQVEQTEANDVRVQQDLQRYKLLVDKREIAQQVYDTAVASARASIAAVAAARANESAAQQAVTQAQSRLVEAQANHQSAETGPQQVSSTRARARAAIADVEEKRALLEQAQLNLQYTKIIAPVSGQVNKSVVVGLNVQSGQQLLTVVPLDDIWITANFKETQLRRMRVGDKAKIHVDSTGQKLNGHVDSIAGATGPTFSLLPPENATGNYVKIVQRIPVKIILEQGENRDHLLRPGMNVVPDVYLQ
ncbi:MAG TPA: HlyD family secretion protein [Verrucomicrobiae bacterium]|nr:HlyD family secretion protein [Verrucomicrobiae bacterium]